MMSRIASYLISLADRRPPDICIGGEADPYMRRWWLIPRNRWFNVYLHPGMAMERRRCLDIVARKALNAAAVRAEIERPVR